MLLPGGLVLTGRGSIMEALSGDPWSWFRIEEPRVLMLSRDAGIVAYAVVAQRADAPEYSALISSAYVRRDGRWRLAFHQQTPR